MRRWKDFASDPVHGYPRLRCSGKTLLVLTRFEIFPIGHGSRKPALDAHNGDEIRWNFRSDNGETHYHWQAVDHKGEVIASFVTKNRDC